MKQVIWKPIKFIVPAMRIPVYTKDKLTKKKIKKKDAMGMQIYDTRIIPKERPRFSKNNQGRTVVHSAPATEAFEKWIRDCFFKEYPGSHAVFYHGKAIPVDDYFLGCQHMLENVTCQRFRSGKDFLDCQMCQYRRRNLKLTAIVKLRDERVLDLDNILKIVLDAMNHVCFYDDSQFIEKHIELVQCAEEEQIEIEMSVLPNIFKYYSLRAGYSLKKLPVNESLKYIDYLKEHKIITTKNEGRFLAYLQRCDKRAYVKKQTITNIK